MFGLDVIWPCAQGMWIVVCVFLGKSWALCPGNVVCGLCFFSGSLQLCVQGMWFVDCVFFGKSSAVCPGNVVCGLCFFGKVFGCEPWMVRKTSRRKKNFLKTPRKKFLA